MGETRDHLETHGGPGRVLCGRTGIFRVKRCADDVCGCCGQPDHILDCNEDDCPDWKEDDRE